MRISFINRCGRVNKEKGQISIFVAFMMIPMFLFFFIMIDVGQLVFERMHLQIAADAGAVAGASVQAMGLNEIADVNHRFVQNWRLKWLEVFNFGIPWCSPPITPWKIIMQWQKELAVIYGHIMNVSSGYAEKAKIVAERTVRMNKPDARATVMHYRTGTGLGNFAGRRDQFLFSHFNVACIPQSGITTVRFPTFRWYYKDRNLISYFFIRVTQPAKPVIAGGTLLSSLTGRIVEIPAMTAFALAKPYGGWIEKASPYYKARLVYIKHPRLVPRPPAWGLERIKH